MAGDVEEYISALLEAPRLGAQVACHRVMEGQDAKYGEPVKPLPKTLKQMLTDMGIEQLYSHQAEAINYVRAGRHVVVATPTASGKTLTYNLPVLEELYADPAAKALYIFPLKALAQDQFKTFNNYAETFPEHLRPTAGIYDGDTTPHFRKKYRNNPPNVLFTNPEMIHLSMLPHHESWAQLFRSLKYIVVDEVHTYRGVMGSHMAHVFRRLIRMCRHYGTEPVFIFCSATVGNPQELCKMLTGLDVGAVTEGGAAQGARHVVFLNPVDSASQGAILLLKAALARELRTIIYTQSRKLTELISMWASEKAGEYAERISAYRAGFLPEERREIEENMASGELLAVISTSALELGIDIGGLDLCIMVGYPGTVMSTWQRGGRVGRKQQDSAVILVAQEDALDQYFMRHPEDFFARPAENAMLNPYNPVIMERHMICAAAELAMKTTDPLFEDERVLEFVMGLVAQGRLFQLADNTENGQAGDIISSRKRPHREVDLRGGSSTMHIEDISSGESIGTIDMVRAFHETYPGAVYLHRGRTYVITELDTATATVKAKRQKVGYYTRVRTSKNTEILEVLNTRDLAGVRVRFGKVRVTEQVTGYEKRTVRGGKMLGIVPLDFDPLVFETESIWFEIPEQLRHRCEEEFYHFMGGIHAFEHAAIGMLPLLVMTDRNDLGGISTPVHQQVGGPAVFVYDGLPGGAGLVRQAYDNVQELLEKTSLAISDCECDLGCPSCVHSPKCGSGNRPIDKTAADYIVKSLISGRVKPDKPRDIVVSTPHYSANDLSRKPNVLGADHSISSAMLKPEDIQLPKRYGVLDIETRRSAQESGGWHRADKMGVSVAVLYDSKDDTFHSYYQDDVPELVEHLQKLSLVIGYNIVRFDYNVLSGLSDYRFDTLPTLDLLLCIKNRLGYLLKLDNVAGATLGVGKSADGLQALEWWKEGRMDLIEKYCKDDVAVTRDVYLYGLKEGHILFQNKAAQKVLLPISGWT
ncbi:MAG: DEAD/DEAH box helicase [Desulfovibrio sp.]